MLELSFNFVYTFIISFCVLGLIWGFANLKAVTS